MAYIDRLMPKPITALIKALIKKLKLTLFLRQSR